MIHIPLKLAKQHFLMKKLIQFLKRWSDRRLRERCVRRVLRSCRGTDRNVLYETENLYFFIKKEE